MPDGSILSLCQILTLSFRLSPATLRNKLILVARLHILVLFHYTQLVNIGEGWDVDGAVPWGSVLS